MLKVNEIFYSLQGEGFNTGMAAIFLRLSGCNRACSFCDTKYHVTFTERSLSELLEYLEPEGERMGTMKRIVFTGGEPTFQKIGPLWNALHDRSWWTAIETNGDRLVEQRFDWITVSPKQDEIAQRHGDELKVVYLGKDVEHFFIRYPDFGHYFLQPCSNKNVAETVEYIKRYPHWRLSLQCQKIINIR
jgi:organic radical activating enzyme